MVRPRGDTDRLDDPGFTEDSLGTPDYTEDGAEFPLDVPGYNPDRLADGEDLTLEQQEGWA